VPSPSPFLAYLGLVILAAAVLPLGLVLVRMAEYWIGRKLPLSVPERLLIALYAAGGLLYLVAAVPVPLFDPPVIAGTLVVGGIGYAALSIRDRGAGFRQVGDFLRSIPGILLSLLTLGLLAAEAAGVAGLRLGNGLDGSVYSLFVKLLLTNHTLPWTLEPYAAVGVAYPQAATVWMSLPGLLYGWPVVSLPLIVPGLFLALSVVGAYCLGDRLASRGPDPNAQHIGLLFAAFFGLVASWPRLYVGGSFDFVICVPLFLLALGWLRPFVGAPARPWKEVVVLGVVIGIASALSAMAGLTLILLLGGFLLAFRLPQHSTPREWVVRWFVVGLMGALSLSRSLIGIAIWFSYPGHVLTPVGSPPVASTFVTPTLTYPYLNGELNPFVLFKYKLSPIPWLSLELAVLLAVGVAVAAYLVIRPGASLSRFLPREMTRPILVGAVVAFLETLGLIVFGGLNLSTSGVQSVVNIEESSILLFTFYQLIALLPLISAFGYLRVRAIDRRESGSPRGIPPQSAATPRRHSLTRSTRGALATGLAIALLVVPLGSGVVSTAVEVPAFIQSHIQELANVSEGDIAALEWSGSHLPSCSQVLVAPGSVGQYLPEYARVGIVYPSFPTPVNLSYQLVVHDLQFGNFTNRTSTDLVQLAITEVFVSGQTSVSYLPFLLPPLVSSPEFITLFSSQDAAVLEFLPGASATHCSG
jgi:hypothetical protein